MSERPYWWFQGDSVKELKEQLGLAGDDPRVEVRIDKQQKMTFRVIGGTYNGGDVNESHVCPPVCPH